MRQRAGYVITISSVAGITGFVGASIYCSTKHAVSGWSEALAKEVAPFGIKVTCIYRVAKIPPTRTGRGIGRAEASRPLLARC